MSSNYFAQPEVAERYAYARPDLNGRFNEELLRRTGRLRLAADFGCGTGLSTVALTEVAATVVGLDPALPMLRRAEAHPRAFYCASLAEAAPLATGRFDLVAAGLALHWFDRERFLEEAARVLVPDGWLFIYNSWFSGTMRDRPGFAAWIREVYLERYPTPSRAGKPIAAPDAPAAGFSLRTTWSMEVDVPMSREGLAHYLTTQSNVSAALERGDDTIDTVTEWLYDELAPFFSEPERVVPFGGSAWLLQRDGQL